MEFTEAERAWIAAHPVIRVGHDTSFAPYALRDNHGHIVGIDPDYLELVARRTGLKFVHEDRKEWPAMISAFRAGEIDILGSMGTSPEREAYMNFTKAYTLAPNVIITRNDAPFLFDIRDLSGRTVSRPRGYVGLKDDLDTLAPGHITAEYASTLECYQAVARGEVFASIGDLANAAYLIKSHRLVNLRLGSVTTDSSEIFFAVRKDWPELAGIMDKCIASFTPFERQTINNRWIAVDVQAPAGWVLAFKVAATLGGLALLVFLVAVWHNRRLARELAERRRVQAELEQAYDRLARISEQKSELLRTVTHDLRNPLTGLTLGIDLLRHGAPLPPEARAQLEQMHATAQLMMRLINDLVDANVLESGRRNFIWTRVDAAAVLREAAEGIAATAARKGIRIDFTAQEPVMPLQSDLTALRQVADNLISNAVKFSPRDAVVEVAARWTGTGLCLQVRDRGPGISPGERAEVFAQYSQGNAKPTGGEKSTGLGLWIVQRVVAALHGRVWSEDAPGGGTVFLVELPRHPPAAPAPAA